MLIKKLKKKISKKEVPEFVAEPTLEIVDIVKSSVFNNVFVSKFNLLKATATKRPVLIWLVVMAVGLSVFYWYGVQSAVKDPDRAAQEETIKLLAEISRIIVLPSNEIPVIATVNDPVKLTNQPFFTKAKAGDKVLIYPNNKKAILYNPVDKKIIEVAPLSIGSRN